MSSPSQHLPRKTVPSERVLTQLRIRNRTAWGSEARTLRNDPDQTGCLRSGLRPPHGSRRIPLGRCRPPHIDRRLRRIRPKSKPLMARRGRDSIRSSRDRTECRHTADRIRHNMCNLTSAVRIRDCIRIRCREAGPPGIGGRTHRNFHCRDRGRRIVRRNRNRVHHNDTPFRQRISRARRTRESNCRNGGGHRAAHRTVRRAPSLRGIRQNRPVSPRRRAPARRAPGSGIDTSASPGPSPSPRPATRRGAVGDRPCHWMGETTLTSPSWTRPRHARASCDLPRA